ncbi:hypothetical protein DFH11DRAFT_1629911 [Phellopilus nigrolimitatus]|nr:hypothetical protein DFH11DRAFT_1629911 [Phellopilus nigrolimitatus]
MLRYRSLRCSCFTVSIMRRTAQSLFFSSGAAFKHTGDHGSRQLDRHSSVLSLVVNCMGRKQQNAGRYFPRCTRVCDQHRPG